MSLYNSAWLVILSLDISCTPAAAVSSMDFVGVSLTDFLISADTVQQYLTVLEVAPVPHYLTTILLVAN